MTFSHSKKIIFFIFLLSTVSIFFRIKSDGNNIFKYDGGTYYAYLPALFIFNDLQFTDPTKIEAEAQGSVMLVNLEKDKAVPKMTMGVSILILPFFLIAHIIALIFHLPANGFSIPYQLAVHLASLFYFLAALLLLRKFLLQFYSEKITSFTILIIAAGTNLFSYAILDASLCHNYEFFLFTLFLVLTVRWHKNPDVKTSCLLGLITGLITLTRYTDALVLVFFIFYGVTGLNSFKEKIQLLFRNWKYILICILFFSIAIFPQMIYWKWVSGKFFIDTYSVEHMFFDNPQILKGLFGFRRGWFVYTPLMLLIIPGIYFLIKNKSPFGKSIFMYTVLTVYIIFSWWCWWYGGGFSCRPIVESYAFFSLPLAEVISRFKKWPGKIILFMLIPFFIILNLFQTYQFSILLMHYQSMTFKSYLLIFAKTYFPSGYEQSLKSPDIQYAFLGMDERKGEMGNFPFLPEKERRTFSIKASNGNYVCPDSTHDGNLIAGVNNNKTCGEFLLILYTYDRCFLKASNGMFLSSDQHLYDSLFANRSIAADWELFTFIDLGKNKFALKNCNSDFVGVDSLTGNLIVEYTGFSENNIFKMEK